MIIALDKRKRVISLIDNPSKKINWYLNSDNHIILEELPEGFEENFFDYVYEDNKLVLSPSEVVPEEPIDEISLLKQEIELLKQQINS